MAIFRNKTVRKNSIKRGGSAKTRSTRTRSARSESTRKEQHTHTLTATALAKLPNNTGTNKMSANSDKSSATMRESNPNAAHLLATNNKLDLFREISRTTTLAHTTEDMPSRESDKIINDNFKKLAQLKDDGIKFLLGLIVVGDTLANKFVQLNSCIKKITQDTGEYLLSLMHQTAEDIMKQSIVTHAAILQNIESIPEILQWLTVFIKEAFNGITTSALSAGSTTTGLVETCASPIPSIYNLVNSFTEMLVSAPGMIVLLGLSSYFVLKPEHASQSKELFNGKVKDFKDTLKSLGGVYHWISEIMKAKLETLSDRSTNILFYTNKMYLKISELRAGTNPYFLYFVVFKIVTKYFYSAGRSGVASNLKKFLLRELNDIYGTKFTVDVDVNVQQKDTGVLQELVLHTVSEEQSTQRNTGKMTSRKTRSKPPYSRKTPYSKQAPTTLRNTTGDDVEGESIVRNDLKVAGRKRKRRGTHNKRPKNRNKKESFKKNQSKSK